MWHADAGSRGAAATAAAAAAASTTGLRPHWHCEPSRRTPAQLSAQHEQRSEQRGRGDGHDPDNKGNRRTTTKAHDDGYPT